RSATNDGGHDRLNFLGVRRICRARSVDGNDVLVGALPRSDGDRGPYLGLNLELFREPLFQFRTASFSHSLKLDPHQTRSLPGNPAARLYGYIAFFQGESQLHVAIQ